MKQFQRVFVMLWALGFSISGTVAEEKPRTALVDIQELFREFYKSAQAQEEINLERARIQKDNNDALQRIRRMSDSIKALKKRLGGMASDQKNRKDLERELVIREQEWRQLERSREQQFRGRHRELNQKMILRMQGILQEIRRHVEGAGEKAGFDYVFDVAGLNTSQVPSVLYAKNATDITPIILKELNKNAPRER